MRFQRNTGWLGLIFAGGIAVALALPLAWGITMRLASMSWQPAEARVTGIKNSSKSAQLRYTYTFDGTEHTGDTFSHLPGRSDSEIINRLSVGNVITVYVDPRNPRQSVVMRSRPDFQIVGLQVLAIAFSTGCAIQSWRTIRAARFPPQYLESEIDRRIKVAAIVFAIVLWPAYAVIGLLQRAIAIQKRLIRRQQ